MCFVSKFIHGSLLLHQKFKNDSMVKYLREINLSVKMVTAFQKRSFKGAFGNICQIKSLMVT